MLASRFSIVLAAALAIASCAPEPLETTASQTGAMLGSGLFAGLAEDAPVAQRRPVKTVQHSVTRIDNYGWLRDENWQEVLRNPAQLSADIRAYLEAENRYYDQATAKLNPLRDRLFAEMRGRIKEDDSSVPAADGPFNYAVRYRDGGNYPVYVRSAPDGGAETVLFDGDLEAEGEDFFSVAAVEHSPNHNLIVYGVDRLGSEYYDLRIRKIPGGDEYPETVPATDGAAVWTTDSESFYYVERDENQRPKRVKQHYLGTDPQSDLLVYEEQDDSYFLNVAKSRSGAYIFISVGNGTSSEYHFLRADAAPGVEPILIAPRRDNELYSVEHHGDDFYILTNTDGAVDFKIVRAPVSSPERDHWQDWVAYQAGTYINDFLTFKNRLVRLERRNALPSIVVSDYELSEVFTIDFAEAAYQLGLLPGYEFDSPTLRFTYESPATPRATFDFNLETRQRTLRKTQEIPSGHNPDLYVVERFFIPADDGAQVPVTVLRLKTTPVDGTAPLLLYGYGSYGITIEAWFNPGILTLVDRGVIYATAHVRGGSAKGWQWYLDGKLAKKKNSFSDFANAAEVLQQRGYGRKGETVISGGSAGGLLVGAALNLRPELFGGAVAAVPFVDVLNTISDADLPLTPPEWVQWGDPIKDPVAFRAIADYSPYDNIRTDVAYPPVLALGGLTDYRVTYWEPAKWIARMRAEAGGGPFFLKINMEAGHAGSTARFERLREKTHEYAFALRLFGLTEQVPIGHEVR